jgi:hypothetical protein
MKKPIILKRKREPTPEEKQWQEAAALVSPELAKKRPAIWLRELNMFQRSLAGTMFFTKLIGINVRKFPSLANRGIFVSNAYYIVVMERNGEVYFRYGDHFGDVVPLHRVFMNESQHDSDELSRNCHVWCGGYEINFYEKEVVITKTPKGQLITFHPKD